MNIRRFYLILIPICLIAIAFNIARAEAKTKRTGTFSNLTYNQESGDLGGVEIRIVYTREGYQAAIQFSEGSPSKLIVTDVQFKGDNVYFNVPETIYEGSFEGQISNERLKGLFKFRGGGDWPADLPRKGSYWD